MEPHLLSCTPDKWFDSCTPQIQSGQDAVSVDDLAAEIKKQKPEVLSDDGWKYLLDAQGDEDTVFSNISSIALAVRSTVEKLYSIKPTAIMQTLPRQGTLSEVQGYRYLPGARATLLDFDRPVPPPCVRRSPCLHEPSVPSENTSETVCLAEFKLKSTDWDRQDNEAQIMSAAAEVMYNDPCRRFMTGFTIEKDQMRLWYFCRGHILVSDFFDFHKEPTLFIRFLLYIQFASLSDLGYDPTVSRRWVNVEGKPYQQIAYEYRIEGRKFLTKGNPLSEDAAFELVSRATRVWEVQEILPSPTPGGLDRLRAESYVLRDAWLYEDAMLEGEIHKDILKELASLDMRNAGGEPTHYESEARRHLLTFICEGWVTTTDDSQEHDITATLPGPSTATRFTKLEVGANSLTTGSQRGSRHDLRMEGIQSKPPSLKHRRRKHARTVIKETCESVYEIKDFRSFVSCLADMVDALTLLRLAGYVHRDVSAGNCLWLPPAGAEPGRGILSDLEYAKRYADVHGHDPRTVRQTSHCSHLSLDDRQGTPAFMATEYQARQYSFLPPEEEIMSFSEEIVSLPEDEFLFNFYHDLESVFWIFAWFIHYRPPAITLQNKSEHVFEKVRTSATALFSNDVQGNSARGSLVVGGRPTNIYRSLKPLYGDLKWLLSGANVVENLKLAYEDLEKKPRKDGTWGADCFTIQPYSAMKTRFSKLLSKLVQDQVDFPVEELRFLGTESKADEEADEGQVVHDQGTEDEGLEADEDSEAGEDQAGQSIPDDDDQANQSILSNKRKREMERKKEKTARQRGDNQ
ncbi:hypothetical protein FA95DRAFT_1550163 [Auriscalpium vulgare]|uniref:Uncharacterized protein n=1 Tax=Auriscalpium vulgare TaxID=40419 RepID=A0ACB8R905_9AGAM|nr:hypothetical protein FA95DRAFT_1550163 [Auriscalpium vulgare]